MSAIAAPGADGQALPPERALRRIDLLLRILDAWRAPRIQNFGTEPEQNPKF